MSYSFKDPIVAISTAAGNGGVGIVRVSGTLTVIRELYQRLFKKDAPQSHRATLVSLKDHNNDLVDRVLAIFFEGPKSYTGESVLEIQAHGGRVLLGWIVEIILEAGGDLGIRIAEPGEFTSRAFLNGKMDLVQAEAVSDLIDATSKNAIKAASRSLRGDFSKKITEINDLLIRLRVESELILDFPEEEVDFLSDYKIAEKLEDIIAKLRNVLSISQQGEILRDGVRVALIGHTNVGKSSLLNALAGDDIAIVSDVEGTTRDKVQTQIHLEGIPFHIIDTAGIRETEDVVEKIGIERSKAEIAKADIILRVVDATLGVDQQDAVLPVVRSLTAEGTPVITILNKIDLLSEKPKVDVSRETILMTSARSGEGLDQIRKELLKISGWKNAESVYLARARHIAGIKSALVHLEKCKESLEVGDFLEFFAEELRLASDDLGDIVGRTSSDDLLGMIFAGFCIGK